MTEARTRITYSLCTIIASCERHGLIAYWSIAPQMEHSFSFFKTLHEGLFTLKICMRIAMAKPYLDFNFGGE